jgi:dTDP-4-dehydrorhamnose 3,5-epimerase
MKITPCALPGLLLIEPDVFSDERGYFLELYREDRYRRSIPALFVQDNQSFSRRGVLRGLHYQTGRPQGKLVTVLDGEIFDVAVDVRRGSPAFGQVETVMLSGENHRQLYIPEGFAHGFQVTGESALVVYKCTDIYDPASERGIRWDDPALAIPWPDAGPILSVKDRTFPTLGDIPEEELPAYERRG